MKVILAFTVPLHEVVESEIQQTLKLVHQSACDCLRNELNYTILKHNMGIHRQSKNLHSHLTYVCDTQEQKTYKILNDKIKRSKSFKNINNKIYITFKYSSDENYDEFKALAYNLKEYATYEDMMQDYKFHETINIEVTKELEELRKYGNEQFMISQKHKFDKENKDKEKNDLKKNMYKYLTDEINEGGMTFSDQVDLNLMTHYVRYICKHILQFYKQNNKSFSIAHLKNQALNFLYNNDYINEEQIICYANI